MEIGKCYSCNTCQEKSYFLWPHSSAIPACKCYTLPSTQEINKKAQTLKSSIRGAPALGLAQGNTGGHGASAAGMFL